MVFNKRKRVFNVLGTVHLERRIRFLLPLRKCLGKISMLRFGSVLRYESSSRYKESLEEVIYKERERISRELHDGIQSELFGISFVLNTLKDKTDSKSLEKRSLFLEKLEDLIGELRLVCHNMQKDTSFNFLTNLENLISERGEIWGISGTLKLDPEIQWEKIKNSIKVQLFRIVQELVMNIIKHAKASTMVIAFRLDKNNILLEVKDDGKGIIISEKRKGIGLANIQQRTEKLNGKFKFIPNESGTTVQILIPRPL